MASYTPNYQLHQWEPQDPFLRTDFNEDLQKIDNGLHEKLSESTGSYVGTGKFGPANKNVLEFEVSPQIVLVLGMGDMAVFFRDNPESATLGSHSAPLTVQWSSNSIEWSTPGGNSLFNEYMQMNAASITYRYFVLY